MSRLGIVHYKSADALFDTLKALSNLAKKFGEMLTSSWMFLVNLELLGGYRQAIPIEAFIQDIKDWVSGDIVHESLRSDFSVSEDLFLDDLSDGMSKLFDNLPNLDSANKKLKSVKEFSSDPANWAGPGSTSSKVKPVAEIGGREAPIKGTKWRTALAMDPQEVEDIILGRGGIQLNQKNKAVEKREAGKVRAVVSSDDYLYLRMTYVSTWLEEALKGSPISSLFMRPDQLQEMWVKMGLDMRSEMWNIPIDQSHFDWQQNKKMIKRFCDCVRTCIRKYCQSKNKDEVLLVLDLIEKALVELDGYVYVGKEKILIEKGVLSGWRWTALMDTVFNYGEFHAAVMMLERLGFDVVVHSIIAQGDDDQVSVKTPAMAVAIALAYEILNFQVNPGKFFISQHRDEFLRQVATVNSVRGYAARAINSILWRNPISMDPAEGDIRVRELCTNWAILIGRGCDDASVERQMLRDISGSMQSTISAECFSAWLRTPAAAGGLGAIYPYVMDGAKLVPAVLENRLVVEERSITGLTRVLSKWGDLAKPDMVSDFAQGVLSAPGQYVLKKPPTFERVRVDYSRIGTTVLRNGNKDLHPKWDVKLPTSLRTQVVNELFRDRHFEGIIDLLEPAQQAFARDLLRRMTRRVWFDWVSGKLPFSIPLVFGWSQPYVSVIYHKILNHEFSLLLLKHHISYSDVYNCAITCEQKCHLLLGKAVVRVGG